MRATERRQAKSAMQGQGRECGRESEREKRRARQDIRQAESSKACTRCASQANNVCDSRTRVSLHVFPRPVHVRNLRLAWHVEVKTIHFTIVRRGKEGNSLIL